MKKNFNANQTEETNSQSSLLLSRAAITFAPQNLYHSVEQVAQN
jgi:hypothetical protein